jgi:hypothetical protein
MKAGDKLLKLSAYFFVQFGIIEDLINPPHFHQYSSKGKRISNRKEPMLNLKSEKQFYQLYQSEEALTLIYDVQT